MGVNILCVPRVYHVEKVKESEAMLICDLLHSMVEDEQITVGPSFSVLSRVKRWIPHQQEGDVVSSTKCLSHICNGCMKLWQ